MNNQKISSIKRHGKVTVLSFLLMSLFIFVTNPEGMPVVSILVFPLLLGLAALSSTKLILLLFFDMTDNNIRILSYSVTAGLLLLFLLGSLKQLGIQDFVLVLLLVSGISFYARYSSRSTW